jgi:hypothetical protein
VSHREFEVAGRTQPGRSGQQGISRGDAEPRCVSHREFEVAGRTQPGRLCWGDLTRRRGATGGGVAVGAEPRAGRSRAGGASQGSHAESRSHGAMHHRGSAASLWDWTRQETTAPSGPLHSLSGYASAASPSTSSADSRPLRGSARHVRGLDAAGRVGPGRDLTRSRGATVAPSHPWDSLSGYASAPSPSTSSADSRPLRGSARHVRGLDAAGQVGPGLRRAGHTEARRLNSTNGFGGFVS